MSIATQVITGFLGAGKTTLLRAALGLIPLEAGTVKLFGREPARMSPQARAQHVAYLAQERRLAWGMSARAVAALGVAAIAHAGDDLARHVIRG